MEINDKTNANGGNLKVGQLMHQENAIIFIGDNVQITQYDPEYENIDQSDDGEKLKAHHRPGNVSVNNALFFTTEMCLELMQGPRLTFHLAQMIATVQRNLEFLIVVSKLTYKLLNMDTNSTHIIVASKSIK